MTIKQTADPAVMQPLYPFGYGLSYTNFELSNLHYDERVETGASFKVSIDIKNTGAIAGSDVIQIYTHSKCPTINRPIKELRAFTTVDLQPNEKKTIEFELDTRAFGYFNFEDQFVIENRPQELFICDHSSNIVLRGEVQFVGKTKEILHDRVFNFKVEEK